MKTPEQIEKEINFCDVFTSTEFKHAAETGGFIPYDGIGFFHDGENETNYCVWDVEDPDDFDKYPYVCWYNR